MENYVVRRGVVEGSKIKVVEKFEADDMVRCEVQSKSKIDGLIVKCYYIQDSNYLPKKLTMSIGQFVEIYTTQEQNATKYEMYAQNANMGFSGVKCVCGDIIMIISSYRQRGYFEKFTKLLRRVVKNGDTFTSDFVAKTFNVINGKTKFYEIPEYIENIKTKLEITSSNMPN